MQHHTYMHVSIIVCVEGMLCDQESGHIVIYHILMAETIISYATVASVKI